MNDRRAVSNLTAKNIRDAIPDRLPDELVEILVSSPGVRIERIVSRGHCSPAGFWYDQDENEWVMLLSGGATLRFEQKDETVNLHPGDWIDIPAHSRHRVEGTDPRGDTIWLAVFYGNPPPDR